MQVNADPEVSPRPGSNPAVPAPLVPSSQKRGDSPASNAEEASKQKASDQLLSTTAESMVRERQRQTETHRDRQRQTERQRDRETERQRQKDKDLYSGEDRNSDRETESVTGRDKDRDRDRKREMKSIKGVYFVEQLI